MFSEDDGSVHTSSVSSEHSDDVESQTASTNKVIYYVHLCHHIATHSSFYKHLFTSKHNLFQYTFIDLLLKIVYSLEVVGKPLKTEG